MIITQQTSTYQPLTSNTGMVFLIVPLGRSHTCTTLSLPALYTRWRVRMSRKDYSKRLPQEDVSIWRHAQRRHSTYMTTELLDTSNEMQHAYSCEMNTSTYSQMKHTHANHMYTSYLLLCKLHTLILQSTLLLLNNIEVSMSG